MQWWKPGEYVTTDDNPFTATNMRKRGFIPAEERIKHLTQVQEAEWKAKYGNSQDSAG